ncbi:MAG: histidine kinase [Eubacteriales bacterium]|nr:histidine kinase [Eubacteriales bacterium]
MQQINVTLDIFSIIICLIPVLYLMIGNRQRIRLNRLYIYMSLFNIGMLLGDVANWTCEGYRYPWFPVLLRLGMFIFYICSAPLLLAFTAYIIEYLSAKVKVYKTFWRVSVVLAAVHAVLIILSQFNGMFYYFNKDNIYIRGKWFWMSQFIPFVLYFIGVSIVIIYRKYQRSRDFWCLLSYIILPVAAEVIQIANYGVALLNAAITVNLLLIFVNIQWERELVIQQQERELADSRIEIMLSQIQPHFLYNTLTTIRQLCDVDPKEAKQAIREFSLFLRANMEFLKSKEPIPFEQELFYAKNYLELEGRRFQSRLKVVYNISTVDFFVPPLTLQPIVENAVRHGVLRREEGGTVTVCTVETEEEYRISVEDDGVGFDSGDVKDGRSHIGIQNVRERLEILCKGKIEIHSVRGIGTTVVISIPKGEK